VTYDPRNHGARCDRCALYGQRIVPPRYHPGAEVTVIGEAPGDIEEREGRAFIGEPSQDLLRKLRAIGVNREDLNWQMAVLCRPPGPMKDVEDAVRRHNKANPDNQLLPPVEACAPRLATELEVTRARDILTLGKAALSSFVKKPSVLGMRGGRLALTWRDRDVRVFPTVEPTFVQRSPRYGHVLSQDLFSAFRWFKGQTTWRDPTLVYNPTPDELRRYLTSPDNPYLTFDLETDSLENLTANVYCIGIGTRKFGMVVGIESRDRTRRFYSPADEEQIKDILREFFTGPKIKVGHNAGYYDALVVENWLGVWPAPILDTMILHRLVDSELPHSLQFVGSMYTEAPGWKTDREGRKRAIEAESDEDLHKYCGFDVDVTDEAFPQLLQAVQQRGQTQLIAPDHAMLRICADMHASGMYVDQRRREELATEYTYRLNHHRGAIQHLTGRAKFNPGSTRQVRDLLFGTWKLEPPVDKRVLLTKKGEPSTKDQILLAALTIRTLTPEQREIIEHTRYYRKASKMLGTYILKLQLSDDASWALAPGVRWDEDEDEEDDEDYGDEDEAALLSKRGIVNPFTGRMHPGYNAAVAVTGRLSSSGSINAQNFPFILKTMVTAAPGHILVGADADQLELRIACSRWRSQQYIEAFANNLDPHSSVTALTCFGDRFIKAAGSEPPWPSGYKFKGAAKSMRDLSKRVQYASQYLATPDTVCNVIRQTEVLNPDDPTGRTTVLPYLDLKFEEVRPMHRNWLAGSKFDVGWDFELRSFRQQGYIAEPVTGRRRYFLDGENPNEIVNYPIQAAGAALMNKALIQIAEQIPRAAWGPGTGIINQCHDSIVVECPLDGAYYDKALKKWVAPPGSIPWKVQRIIEEAMNQSHPSLPDVTFTATAELGMTWAEV
jgi:uracil-DNA glycosylase family 4